MPQIRSSVTHACAQSTDHRTQSIHTHKDITPTNRTKKTLINHPKKSPKNKAPTMHKIVHMQRVKHTKSAPIKATLKLPAITTIGYNGATAHA